MFTLEKKPGQDFRVLNLSDPQLDSHFWNEDERAYKILVETVTALLERVKPDLITISGDLNHAPDTEGYVKFVDYIESFGIPWAPVFGNHDNQCGAEYVNELADMFLEHPHCLFEKGDPAMGCGNYVIKIVEEGRPVEAIIMMDSHDSDKLEHEDGTVTDEWGRLWPNQIEWYREIVAQLKAEGFKESTIILHIPIYAYRDAWAAAFRSEFDPMEVDPQDSGNPKWWNPGFEDSEGVRREGISSYGADEGMMDAMVELGHTKYMIAGHDHVNNTMITWRGVRLIFSLKLGEGCYWYKWLNGGTVIDIGDAGVSTVRHEFVDVLHYWN